MAVLIATQGEETSKVADKNGQQWVCGGTSYSSYLMLILVAAASLVIGYNLASQMRKHAKSQSSDAFLMCHDYEAAVKNGEGHQN